MRGVHSAQGDYGTQNMIFLISNNSNKIKTAIKKIRVQTNAGNFQYTGPYHYIGQYIYSVHSLNSQSSGFSCLSITSVLNVPDVEEKR